MFCGKICFVMRSILKEEKTSTVQKARIIETLYLTNVKREMMKKHESSNIVSEAAPTS